MNQIQDAQTLNEIIKEKLCELLSVSADFYKSFNHFEKATEDSTEEERLAYLEELESTITYAKKHCKKI